MNVKDCFNLGYIAKLHGYKGEVSLFLDVTDPLDYKDLKLIYCEINKHLVPFSILSMRIVRNCYAILKLDGVESEKQSRELLKKRVYIPKNPREMTKILNKELNKDNRLAIDKNFYNKFYKLKKSLKNVVH